MIQRTVSLADALSSGLYTTPRRTLTDTSQRQRDKQRMRKKDGERD